MSNNGVRWINFNIAEDSEERGCLISLECNHNLPFTPARVFYIFGVPNWAVRGGHAHKKCQQVLVALRGKVDVIAGPIGYRLDKSTRGLYIPSGIPVSMKNWRTGTILLVIASEPYDPNDYVREEKGNGK